MIAAAGRSNAESLGSTASPHILSVMPRLGRGIQVFSLTTRTAVNHNN